MLAHLHRRQLKYVIASMSNVTSSKMGRKRGKKEKKRPLKTCVGASSSVIDNHVWNVEASITTAGDASLLTKCGDKEEEAVGDRGIDEGTNDKQQGN